MNLRKNIVFILGLILLMTTFISAQKGDKLPELNYTEYQLLNGLRVVMHQDKSTPIVAVNVWYHVGSIKEEPGRTGFAHLFEHMMFQGSKNYNDEYFGPLQKAGANINGSTNPDRTNYYEVVPSNFLELALFLESDRMGNLLDAMTQEKLDNQRDVVKNERRQRYDNRPYGTAFEKIQSLIYPKDHPYHWTTIGSLADLSAASMDDVKSFFRKYYVPNNASLVIAGNFDEIEARKWVQKYFGPIKRGKNISRPNPKNPTLDGEIRKTYEDAVRLPRRYMVWHTVPRMHKDEAALDILASVLSSGRGSRLQSKLLHEKRMVQNIFASNPTREIGGNFSITATSTTGPPESLDEIEKEINAEIESIKNEAPSMEEIERAKNGYESQFVFGLQTVLGKADAMNSNATFFGKPALFQKQLEEYRKVTPADIQRVAKEYLNENRLVMSFVPGKKQGAPSNSAENNPTSATDDEEDEKDEKAENKDYSKNLPPAGKTPKFSIPQITKRKLSNGLNVWVVPQKELPIVSMNLVIKTGGSANPAEKEGLASFTAGLLNEGTKNRTAVEISNEMQNIGAGNVGSSSGWDSTDVTVSALTKHLDKALEIYADVVTNPTFPEKELESNKRRALIGLRVRRNNPNAVAGVAYSKLLYGTDHPYGRSLSGTEDSIKEMKREELVNFYETYYRPNNATLIVVGDVDARTLIPKLQKAFAGWKPGKVPNTSVPAPKAFDKPGIYIVDKPGAAQSVVQIGQIGVARDNPDYVPLLVMNSILGGQFSARLNMNLREDKGYTYGARSGFSFRRGAGPFTASAGVQTAVTKESIVEFMKELNGIRGDIPITQEELDYNKQSIIRRFPRTMETIGQISGQLSNLVIYGLNDRAFNNYLTQVNAVSLKDVNRVANKYLQPEKMAILIVGDKKVIEPKLKAIDNWGNAIRYLDSDGNMMADDDDE